MRFKKRMPLFRKAEAAVAHIASSHRVVFILEGERHARWMRS
jgi:hypothetical protein